jgi:uncharacterized surface protein with fasciclin (FAS1) repeats
MSLAPRRALSLAVALCLGAAPAHAQHDRASGPTIPQVAKAAGQFGTLLAAVDAAGLTETLLGPGPFTLFAPTDEAFRRLPAGTVESLLRPENREQLRTILTYHVVAGRVSAAQARRLSSAATVAGPRVQVRTEGDLLRINEATVRIADVPARNGVVHVIDRVLLPPADGRTGTTGGRGVDEFVQYAIARGAPLFNDGRAAATVAIYEVAARGLLALGDAVATDGQRALRDALRTRDGQGVEDRAWALRRALDEVSRLATGRGHTASRM